MYDLIIIGGGPAGSAAAVYAARKKIKTLLIAESWGGQSTDSLGIENWIGTLKISGEDFAKMLRSHVEAHIGESLELKEERVEEIQKRKTERNLNFFAVKTHKTEYQTKTVLIAAGSHRRKLEIPGAKEFEAKGIAYCASCDAPLFADQDVAVIGGGNAAFEAALQLAEHAKSVTLLNRSGDFKADPITIDLARKNSKITIVINAVPTEIKGEKFVKALVYEDKKSQTKVELPVTGIFVEIGLLPNTWFAENLVEMNSFKQIKVDPKNQRASEAGIWAAGDATDGLFHQNNIAAGDAVKALEDIYLELHKIK